MTRPAAPLDSEQLERLADLLDRRAVPFKGLNLEALDGYLSALAVSPDPVTPAEWQPAVWGGKPPRWRDADEERDVHALLAGHWNLVVRRVRHEGELPDALLPLVWLPEDIESEQHADLDIGADWAMGFLRGVELRKTAWRAWFDSEDWILDIFEQLTRLVSGQILGEDRETPPTPMDVRARLDIVLDLPSMLADLHHHRIEHATPRTPIRREATPGRNDPCSCGSGRKYKKCCGAGTNA